MVKIRKKGTKGKKEEKNIVTKGRYLRPLTMLRELDQTFDDLRSSFEDALWSPFWERFSRRGSWPIVKGDFFREPDLDLIDEGKEFLLKAELPGISKNDIHVNVSKDEIEIKAKTKEEKEEKDKGKNYLHKERSYSSFYRSLALPEEIVPDKVNAKLEDGILNITLPKKEPKEKSKKKRVNIK